MAPPSWKEEEEGIFMGWVGVEGIFGSLYGLNNYLIFFLYLFIYLHFPVQIPANVLNSLNFKILVCFWSRRNRKFDLTLKTIFWTRRPLKINICKNLNSLYTITILPSYYKIIVNLMLWSLSYLSKEKFRLKLPRLHIFNE